LRSRKEIIVAKSDYVPNADATYDTWLSNFVTVLTANAAALGLAPAELVPIQDSQSDFSNAQGDLVIKRGAAKAAVQTKVSTRSASETILRPLVQRIVNHPGMTPTLRSQLGLSTDAFPQVVAPIEELTPNIRVEAALGQVRIHWGPNPTLENRNGKPEGVFGANIYRKKAGESAYSIVGFSRTSPFLDNITGDGADYTYAVRYRGLAEYELSNQSDAVTVAARGELAA